MTYFQNKVEKDDSIILSRRHSCSNTYKSLQNGIIDKTLFNYRFRFEFLDKTSRFGSKWGIDMVPIDIKVAIKDVKSNASESMKLWSDLRFEKL